MKSIEYLSDICISSITKINGTLFFVLFKLDLNLTDLFEFLLYLLFKYLLYILIISKKKLSILLESFTLWGPSNSFITDIFSVCEL